MKIPLPTQIMLEVSNVVTAYWWMAAPALVVALVRLADLHAHRGGAALVGRRAAEDSAAGRRAAQGRDRAFRARHGDAGGQ